MSFIDQNKLRKAANDCTQKEPCDSTFGKYKMAKSIATTATITFFVILILYIRVIVVVSLKC